MSRTKRFSKQLYNANDAVAKETVIEYLKTQGVIAQENPDKYGPDLVTPEKYYECEVKHNWKGKKFPFGTIQIPYRKAKFLMVDKPVLFCMLNSDKTMLLILTDEDLKKSTVVTVPNKYVNSEEQFFQVLTSKAKFIEL